MDIIKRHKATNQSEADFEGTKERFQKFDKHIKSNRFEVRVNNFLLRFYEFFCEAEYHNDHEWAEKFLFSATEISRVVFELAENNGKSVSITYDGVVQETDGKIEEGISSFGFLRMLCYVYTLTRSEVLKNEIKKAEFWDDTTSFWKSYIKGVSRGVINDQLKEREADYLKTKDDFGMEYHSYVLYYEFKCFAAVINGNEEEFNKYLQEGLEKHYEFYCEENMFLEADMNGQNDYSSFVSLPLLAVSCLAHDLGIKVTVESEYIPRWIIEKDFHYDLKKIV